MIPKWEDNVNQMKEAELREQLVDNPQLKSSILKTASSKATSILKQFQACDSAVNVAGFVEGFDNVVSKLDDNLAGTAEFLCSAHARARAGFEDPVEFP